MWLCTAKLVFCPTESRLIIHVFVEGQPDAVGKSRDICKEVVKVTEIQLFPMSGESTQVRTHTQKIGETQMKAGSELLTGFDGKKQNSCLLHTSKMGV